MKPIALILTVFISGMAPWATLSPAQAATGGVDFEKVFRGQNGCFLLYDLKTGTIAAEYNKRRCAERVFACSTFKVPLALMAFDKGILKDGDTSIKWDGIERKNDDWNRDQTPRTWLKYSAVWVSQWITPQLGMAAIKKYLADFNYGNQDMSGGITQAWLSSTLKISAEEQIQFLRRFWTGNLNVSSRAIQLVKTSMDSEKSDLDAILRGKTGSGFLDGREDPKSRRVGWFIGEVTSGEHDYVFATNFEENFRAPDSGPAGYAAKAMTETILDQLGLFHLAK